MTILETNETSEKPTTWDTLYGFMSAASRRKYPTKVTLERDGLVITMEYIGAAIGETIAFRHVIPWFTLDVALAHQQQFELALDFCELALERMVYDVKRKSQNDGVRRHGR